MDQWKRLLIYLGLNILVSVCATLAVLWLWDRAHPAPILPVINPTAQPADLSSTQPAVAPSPTAGPAGELPKLIVIESVVGVGKMPDELVALKRVGEGDLDLTGWRLQDGDGNVYTFPAITLYPNGGVQVHTATGADTVIDLYWNRDAAVWKEGAMVTLLDGQGNVRATYRIP